MRGSQKKFRKSMSKGKSKKVFRKTAGKTHKKNVKSPVMRGGIRL